MGRRIAKTIEGQTTYFLYTDEGLIAELNQQGNITKAYGWLADTSYSTSPLWQAEPKVGETTITDLKQAQFHTLTTDHLGTVQMATNEAGQVTWKAQSEAFGQTTLDEKNQITMNLRFPGQYFDEETGTHYNYFRDYQPTTGRYIQRDPIGLQGGINTYAYVGGSPLTWIDSHGLAKYKTPKNPNKKAPPAHRIPSGARERKVGHPDGEEHNIKSKGRNRGVPGGGRMRGFIPLPIIPWLLLKEPSPDIACSKMPFSPMCQPGGALNWDDLDNSKDQDDCENGGIIEYNEDINDDYDGWVGRFQREAGPRQENECIVRNYLGQIVTDPNGGFCPWGKN